MKITLCDKKLVGDIPSYELTNYDKTVDLISYWLVNKNFDKSVFVSFISWPNSNDYRYEIGSILVSALFEDIMNFIDIVIDFEEYDNFKDIKCVYNIFEFDSYEEAFKYCTDLKEGV